jgi:thioredoxin 1
VLSCKMMVPVLKELAEQHTGRLTEAAIDAGEHPEPADQYAVTSIPTILLFSDGILKKRIVGAHTKAALIQEISDVL